MDKQIVKVARQDMNRVGAIMLVYFGLMNMVSAVVMLVDLVAYLIRGLATGQALDFDAMLQYFSDMVLTNGWMYIVSIVVGLLVILLLKGRGYWRREVFIKNRPMTAGSFFAILCVFLSAQFFFQLFSTALEWLLNLMGLSAMAAVELATTTGSSFSMYLYACFLGPIAEELLFRGLVLRTLKPWGKQAAIIISAVIFGIFHGNIVQIPFAFAVGVVLGYVAVEYSITWAIVLHIINNFVIADLLIRLMEILPGDLGLILESGIFLAVALIAVVLLILRRKEVAAYLRENRITREVRRGAFTSVPLILFTVIMLALCLFTIRPL